MRAKRLFVSLDLPETIARDLVRLDPLQRGVRWLRPEQMHLTLSFLGYVEPAAEEKLRERLCAIRFTSFFLPLQGLGKFPKKGPVKILWLGVGQGHPHLFQLHKRIAEAALGAGLEPDLRPWHPHITLARCESISPEAIRKFLREQADFDAGLIPVNQFQLKSSQLTPAGSHYTTELAVRAQ